jgi:hypothetical protein
MMMITERPLYRIYKVETDDFTGRLQTRLSFEQHPATCTHNHNDRGFVVSDILDGGCIGAILAPVGSQLVELETGDTAIELPDGTILGAGDAWRAAREGEFGLQFPRGPRI